MTAIIWPCGKYRYLLTRQMDDLLGEPTIGKLAIFIMLNPSTADATVDDPTIRKCMGFARRFGCTSLAVLNLFAVRATDPPDMMAADDPVGPLNHRHFERILAASDDDATFTCAWGANGGFMEQDLEVMGWLDHYEHRIRPMCLGTTKDGHPKHPLYVPYTTELISYRGRRFKAVNGKTVPEVAA